MEKIFGRYVATTRYITGAYCSEYADNKKIVAIREKTAGFMDREGRRPRMLIAKMGQDGHDRGFKVVASAYSDFGFDIDLSPMFQTPAEIAKTALENDVHMIAVSSLAAGHKVLVPALIDILKTKSRADILVFAGGIIPETDYDFLYKTGVSAIFGPGTCLTESAITVLDALEQKIKLDD